jgi:hypothetical protein
VQDVDAGLLDTQHETPSFDAGSLADPFDGHLGH